MKRTIGGDRIGAGNKMTVDLKTYNRSTHNLSYLWRSTMASGTLVPFICELGLAGDTFDINLNCDIMTHPTVGPLFGQYKVQLDVYQVPIRLYQAQLHNNKLGIGMNMEGVKLPQISMNASNPNQNNPIDNQQINPSSIFSYLNIRGLGSNNDDESTVYREFNAIPYLAYWDIYKNYYANKQEEVGAVIHNAIENLAENIASVVITTTNVKTGNVQSYTLAQGIDSATTIDFNDYDTTITIEASTAVELKPENICIWILESNSTGMLKKPLTEVFNNFSWDDDALYLMGTYSKIRREGALVYGWDYIDGTITTEKEPKLEFFPLKNIDDMREDILSAIKITTPFYISKNTYAPYGLALQELQGRYAKTNSQEGLAIKTYQSDLFNNWMKTDWIDGENGISAITAIDTSDGNFTIDTLNLSKKVYNMLNRIAISGGSYDDWQETVYTHEGRRKAESPIYEGGLIKDLVFQEVVSNSESSNGQPLGTLAGRGVMGKKHKGGKIRVKMDEAGYVIGIISLTPLVDYSQGNKWDVNLKTMDDFHKPELDEIGFQDLITDQMAWFDTDINDGEKTFKSAGKQPAWINYMTNVNQTRGNFAIEENEMFMTLNRKYEYDWTNRKIKDLTTYIDPVKFNHIFAQTSRDAQNFWTQIAVNITARRKMSAKLMPNL